MERWERERRLSSRQFVRKEPIYHFDFYRIKKESEAYDIGFEDYVYSGNLCFMEWPELIEDLLPEDAVKVMIEEEEDGRRKVKTLPLAPPC